jgi:outer membrane protein insertion porin family
MSARACLPGLILAAGLAGAPAGWAQGEAGPSMDVRSIEIRQDAPAPVEEGFVRAHIGARVGQRLDRTAVSDDVRRLLETGRFADVGAAIEPEGDGVRLVYVLTARARLSEPVRVQGAEHFDAARIREWINLDAGDWVDDTVLGTRARRVEAEYREALFTEPAVRWTIEPDPEDAGRAIATVIVDEGPRRKVAASRVEGATVFSQSALRRSLRVPSRWNPMRWVFPKPVDNEELAAGRFEIAERYRRAGYLDARVSEPRLEVGANDRITVVLNVEEGVQYRCTRVDLEGVTLFPEEDVRRVIPLQPGATAAADLIDASAQAVRDYYGSRGFIETRVRTLLDTDETAGSVGVLLSVKEGALTRIRNIRVRGNTRTRDKVIRRELLVYPGETFDEVRLHRSERRVMNLGFFERVNTYNESTPVPDEKDVVFEVAEKRTGQFMVGAGFSSIDKFLGFVEVAQGNFDLGNWPTFTGGGQKLKVNAEFGTKRNDYGLSFVEPWFLDRKLSLGLDLYHKDYEYTDYDILRAGGAVTLGKALPYACRVDFRYGIEKAELTDLDDAFDYVDVVTGAPVPFDPEDAVKSAFRVALTHDTRNNPFIPTRGTRATAWVELMGGPFGFDTDLYHTALRANHYVPLWWNHVLSLEGRCEFVDEFGGTGTVPISDRLFIGGGRTLRGFEYRDVGPKARVADADPADTSYRPYGGSSLAMASAEYLLPVVPNVRFALFYDVGNVWEDAYDMDLDELASSAGIGLRLDLPGFPIRIDRAWIVERDNPITDEDPWVIWIGYD